MQGTVSLFLFTGMFSGSGNRKKDPLFNHSDEAVRRIFRSMRMVDAGADSRTPSAGCDAGMSAAGSGKEFSRTAAAIQRPPVQCQSSRLLPFIVTVSEKKGAMNRAVYNNI